MKWPLKDKVFQGDQVLGYGDVCQVSRESEVNGKRTVRSTFIMTAKV